MNCKHFCILDHNRPITVVLWLQPPFLKSWASWFSKAQAMSKHMFTQVCDKDTLYEFSFLFDVSNSFAG